jgi:enamine deaminase RidA (YjgF/YER057c/UK114 family)
MFQLGYESSRAASTSFSSVSANQNPRRANPTQLRANIEQATAVIEANIATALIGCMTKPYLKIQIFSDSRQRPSKVKLEKSG